MLSAFTVDRQPLTVNLFTNSDLWPRTPKAPVPFLSNSRFLLHIIYYSFSSYAYDLEEIYNRIDIAIHISHRDDHILWEMDGSAANMTACCPEVSIF